MEILIYGSSDFGIQTYYFIKYYPSKEYNFLGFIDDIKKPGIKIIEGYKTLGGFEYLADLKNKENTGLFVAIGYKDLKARFEIYDKCRKLGYVFPNFIHPKANIEKDFEYGEGNYILSGAVIDQSTKIGNLNFIDMGCVIGHNTVIGNNNYICAGTVHAGFVKVGDSNFIGIQSCITDGIKIGSNNFINAGSLIARNVDDFNKVVTVIVQKRFKIP